MNQSQAIGSLILVVVILFFMAAPLVYRYVLIDPVEIEEPELAAFESVENKEETKIISANDKPIFTTYQKKEHRVLPTISKGEEITLHEPIDAKEDKVQQKNLPLINLNTADTTLLKSVRGIGSFYANRIIKYRTRLGGFVSVAQLDDVYNLPIEAKENLIVRLDSSALEPYAFIDINKETFKELLSDVHFDYEDVKKIVNYRRKSNFYTKKDLYKTGLDSAKVKDVLPYVKID